MTVKYLTKEESITRSNTVGVQYNSDQSDRAVSIKKSVRTRDAFVVELTDEDGDSYAVVIRGAQLRDFLAKARAIVG